MTGSIPHKATVNDIDMMGLAIPFPHQPCSRSETRDLLGATSGEELVRAGDVAFELSTKAGVSRPRMLPLGSHKPRRVRGEVGHSLSAARGQTCFAISRPVPRAIVEEVRPDHPRSSPWSHYGAYLAYCEPSPILYRITPVSSL